MIDVCEAKQLTKVAIANNKIKRLEEAEIKYGQVLKDLEELIRETCERGCSGIELPHKGWPRGVNFKDLAELLQESYGFKCYLKMTESREVGLKITW